jgi:hypothetical protein
MVQASLATRFTNKFPSGVCINQSRWKSASVPMEHVNTTDYQVRKPRCSGFRPSVLSYFNTTISVFRDRFRRNGMTPRGS